VAAKLLYSHPPPGVDADEYNSETRSLVLDALSRKQRIKRAPANRVGKKSATFIPEVLSDEEGPEGVEIDGDMASLATSAKRPAQSSRANALDKNFFLNSGVSSRMFVNGAAASGAISRGALYAHQRQIDDTGKRISGRKLRELESVGAIVASGTKKHHKGNKRSKARSGGGYE
jgi:large subunit GTPase 1